MSEHLDPIVEALRDERLRREWSMRHVASRAGIGVSNIHYWEYGVKSPSLSSLRAWAGAFGRTVVVR